MGNRAKKKKKKKKRDRNNAIKCQVALLGYHDDLSRHHRTPKDSAEYSPTRARNLGCPGLNVVGHGLLGRNLVRKKPFPVALARSSRWVLVSRVVRGCVHGSVLEGLDASGCGSPRAGSAAGRGGRRAGVAEGRGADRAR